VELLEYLEICALAGDWVYRVQSRWYPVTRDTFNVVIYSFIGLFKMLFLMFNLVPYIALVILGRKEASNKQVELIMTLSLKESQAVAEMAELLYDFLPGSGSPSWEGHVSFKTVAARVGVVDFWQPRSKTPMITALLARTLEFRR
jgi:hypothetical protein